MDLFVWLLGCLLAFLWSSSVKGGGKFDTFLPAEGLTVNRSFSRSSECVSFQRRKIRFYIKQKCVNCKSDPFEIFKHGDITL